MMNSPSAGLAFFFGVIVVEPTWKIFFDALPSLLDVVLAAAEESRSFAAASGEKNGRKTRMIIQRKSS